MGAGVLAWVGTDTTIASGCEGVRGVINARVTWTYSSQLQARFTKS